MPAVQVFLIAISSAAPVIGLRPCPRRCNFAVLVSVIDGSVATVKGAPVGTCRRRAERRPIELEVCGWP
jgi:hypothetical protein